MKQHDTQETKTMGTPLTDFRHCFYRLFVWLGAWTDTRYKRP